MKRPILMTVLALLALVGSTGFSHGAPAEKKKGGGDSFIQLPTLAAGMFRASGAPQGVLTVDIGLDVQDVKLRQQVMAYRPILQDAYTRYLLSYAASLRPGTPPSPDTIGAALQRLTDETLKRPGAVMLLGTILIN